MNTGHADAGAEQMNDLTHPELGQREWHRVAIDMPVILISGREKISGQLMDISVGGALFKFDRVRVRLPGPCVLWLPLPTTSADHTAVGALVVRTAAGRFGLRWTQRFPAHALVRLALPLAR